MQALRKIYQITSNTVTITVPDTLKNCQVEILILPLAETIPQRMVQNQGWRDKLARANQIRTKIAERRKQPLTPAVDIINQARQEQNEFFDNLY